MNVNLPFRHERSSKQEGLNNRKSNFLKTNPKSPGDAVGNMILLTPQTSLVQHALERKGRGLLNT